MTIGIVAIFLGIVAGAALSFLFLRWQNRVFINRASESEEALVKSAKKRAEGIMKEAAERVEAIRKEIREEFERYREAREKELNEFQVGLQVREGRYEAKQSRLASAETALNEQWKALDEKEREIAKFAEEAERLNNAMLSAMQEKAGVSPEEARQEWLLNKVETMRLAIQRDYYNEIEDIKENAERLAKAILDTAYARCEPPINVERINYALEFPSEKIKQRAIESGDNWLAKLSETLSVEASWTEDRNKIFIAGQDYIAREVGRRVVNNCIAQSKFTPDDVVKFTGRIKGEVEKVCQQAAEELIKITNIGKVAPEVKNLIGKLRFRTSYTQNQWHHAIEVAFICGIIAAELGLNQQKARRAGTFHDIGKAVDYAVEGSHALIAADILKKSGEEESIVNAVAAHHNDEPLISPYAAVVIAGDSVSGARPGARHERVESYFDRLRDLERIAREVKGVAKAYALQAGRELRVYVDNRRISDDECQYIAETIAKKVEENLVYPGQIQITVIRETVVSNYA